MTRRTRWPRHLAPILLAITSSPSSMIQPERPPSSALHEAGFADSSAAICPGQQLLVNWAGFAKHPGPLKRLVDLYPSEEHAALEDYLAEVAQGASFVSVHLTEHRDITRARDLLKPLGGHAMRYYGDL